MSRPSGAVRTLAASNHSASPARSSAFVMSMPQASLMRLWMTMAGWFQSRATIASKIVRPRATEAVVQSSQLGTSYQTSMPVSSAASRYVGSHTLMWQRSRFSPRARPFFISSTT